MLYAYEENEDIAAMVRSKVEERTEGTYLSLTPEQTAILQSTGDIRINAVAGSGKTTTIIEYARTRPVGSRILYLAFNRSVKMEAELRFAARDLHNVKVETAHSLAYKRVVPLHGYRLRSQGYKTHEIAALLGLQGNGEKHAEYIIANHINKFLSYFCNSDKEKVQDLDYSETVTDAKARAFVKACYPYLEHQTRQLLARMDRGEIEITHDFYLKKFQLQNPVLPFDYILFDEGQDASAAMLDVFLKQKATKVIVGDTHQQIYGWRYAVNSLEKAPFTTYHLSTSFRFSQDIADLAMGVLQWKNHLGEQPSATIVGGGNGTKKGSKATIARTNLGLLLRAITFVTEHPEVKYIYFEGNIHSYTYADDGTSLYDVLNLYNGQRTGIRDPLVQQMKDIDELEDYIEKTGDVQLGMMVEIVKEYGARIPALIKVLKEKHVDDADRSKAEMVFSTVHRCKGMEYDAIQLVNDFVTEATLERQKEEAKKEGELQLAKWNEEINLLYVALTRTRSTVRLPDVLLPKNFPPSPMVQLVDTKKTEDKKDPYSPAGNSYLTQRAYLKNRTTKSTTGAKDFSGSGRQFSEAHQPWTPELEQELVDLYQQDMGVWALSKHFGRKPGAILARLKKLGISYGDS
ncbi:MAG TPA: UvrD-helicase domain-containing protein [Chitinophagaceae bacterium]